MTIRVNGREVRVTAHARHRFQQRHGGSLFEWVEQCRLRRKRPRWLPPPPPDLMRDPRDVRSLTSHYLVGPGGAFALARDGGVLVATTFMRKGTTPRLAERRAYARNSEKATW